jgi:hypothetical protein
LIDEYKEKFTNYTKEIEKKDAELAVKVRKIAELQMAS